jgi:ribonuclease D
MLDPAHIVHVHSQEAVQQLGERVAAVDRVALDTEADSLHHYFEKVCLLQLSVPDGDYIVDPLASLDLAPLLEPLKSKELIIQGADYDLRMMNRDYGFKASRIFDTMSAAQLLGYEKFSYAALVELNVGVVQSKHGQKADWSQRPLPEKLITYAAADTHYLFTVADKLEDELRQLGRLEWHQEVCERLLDYVAEGMREPDPDRQWRIKGWHTLRGPRGWSYLRELWRWRDTEAQRADFPPFKVMRNETLIELAQWANSGADPHYMPKLPRNIIGRRRRLLDQAVTHAASLPQDQWPKPLGAPRRDTPPPDEALIARLKQIRDRVAADLKLDPGVLLPSASLSAIAIARPADIAGVQQSGDLYNWQTKLMGADLLEAVQTTKPAGKRAMKTRTRIETETATDTPQ